MRLMKEGGGRERGCTHTYMVIISPHAVIIAGKTRDETRDERRDKTRDETRDERRDESAIMVLNRDKTC